MRGNLIIFTLLMSFSNLCLANFSCRLTQQLGNPAISSNAKFWEEFGRISENGSDRELASLLQKYEVDARSPNSSPNRERRSVDVPSRAAFQLNQVARNELRNLQPAIRDKANEFLELAKGGSPNLFAQLRNNQGRWQLEKLNGKKSDLHSVRLNQGYRVVFRERPDRSIEIVNFSKTATHGGGH